MNAHPQPGPVGSSTRDGTAVLAGAGSGSRGAAGEATGSGSSAGQIGSVGRAGIDTVGRGLGSHESGTGTTSGGGTGTGDGSIATVRGSVRPVNSSRETHGERTASARVELVSAQRPTSTPSSAASTTAARSARRSGAEVGTATIASTSPRRHMSIAACGVPGAPRSHATTPEPPGPSTRTRPTRPDDEQSPSVAVHPARASGPWPAEYAATLTSTCSLPTV